MKLKGSLLMACLLAGCSAPSNRVTHLPPREPGLVDRKAQQTPPTRKPAPKPEAILGERVDPLKGAAVESVWQERLLNPVGGRENRAIVRAVRGSVVVSSNGGRTWRPARVASPLSANSLIRTSLDSGVDLFLGDNGPVLRIAENSELRIVRLTVEATGIEKTIDTMLEVHQGKILGSVKKLASGSSYLVRTQRGVLKITGTEFLASANGRFGVVSGNGFVFENGKQIQLQEGQQYQPGEGISSLPESESRLAAEIVVKDSFGQR